MDKDESLDRLLRRGATAGQEPPAGQCLDAGTLAAWLDGGLTAQERAAAEVHAADCDRCLSMLAALAKTTPPPSVPSPRWFSVRWVVPLATAAVAITAWVLVQDVWQSPNSFPTVPISPAVETVKPSEPVPMPEADMGAAAKAAPPTDAREERERASAREGGRAGSGPPNPSNPLRKDTPASTSPADTKLEGRRAQSFEAPALPEPRAEPLAAAESKPSSPAPAPPPPGAPEPNRTPASTTSVERQAAPHVLSDTQSAAETGLARQVARAPLLIVSPNRNVQWRVSGTTIERSTDGGATWREPVRLTSPGFVAAGFSTSPTVCWLVGTQGTVFLSTDGATWRRIPFPEASVDLVRVTARDADEATVTAADGRNFRTSDGGRTWTAQEDPATPF